MEHADGLAAVLLPFIEQGYRLLLVHGNGPQVGNMLIRMEESVSSASDEAAVRAVVAKYVDAREAKDPAAIGALFTDNADQFNSGGQWRRGREAIVKGTLQSSQRNSGSRTITVKAVRFPSPGFAIADGEYGIGEQRLWTTLVLSRQGNAWKIEAIRNIAPRTN